MTTTPNSGNYFRRFTAIFLAVSIFAVTSAYAQTAAKVYDVELAVSEGKKAVETDAVLTFNEKSFTVMPDKASFKTSAKTFNYSDIKQADHSYSKKPMLSGGGVVAAALLVSVFLIPLVFIKKKKHWMTVQSGSEFAVIKLGDNNFRQIVAEFETRGVKVNDLKEQDK